MNNNVCSLSDIKSGDQYPNSIEFFVATDDLKVINLSDLYSSSEVTDFIATMTSND